MKSSEEKMSDESQTLRIRFRDPKEKCPDCHRKNAWNSKGVECEKCENYYHIKFQKMDKEHYAKFGDVVWMCMNCKKLPVGDYGRKRKLFERYLDDIICTVKNDPNKLLQEVNDLNPNLEFTLKT